MHACTHARTYVDMQILPKGTVQFELVSDKRLKGLVTDRAGDGIESNAVVVRV